MASWLHGLSVDHPEVKENRSQQVPVHPRWTQVLSQVHPLQVPTGAQLAGLAPHAWQ